MKKNLLQPEVKEEIISRIQNLTPQTERKWGKMNVNQMMRHGYEGLLMAYGDIKTERRGNWLSKQFMRFIILKTDIAAPPEKAITFPEIDQVERGINPHDFDKEKQTLISEVKNFPSKNLAAESSLLGKMSTENWARLNYTHLDHHLKQFGV